MIELPEGPVAPCAFLLSQTCQAAIGRILNITDRTSPDLDSLATMFDVVPCPKTYGDALCSSALLYRFLQQAAVTLHEHVHGGTIPTSCEFDHRYDGSLARANQAQSGVWTATAAVTEWAAAYGRRLRAYHRGSIIDRALQRLRDQFDAPLSAATLARIVGCSVPVLRRELRRATGRSARQYVIQLRVDRAIDLLCGTDWKIAAIAREVGWKSTKDLHSAVKRQVGITPGQVRHLAGADIARLRAQPAAHSLMGDASNVVVTTGSDLHGPPESVRFSR